MVPPKKTSKKVRHESSISRQNLHIVSLQRRSPRLKSMESTVSYNEESTDDEMDLDQHPSDAESEVPLPTTGSSTLEKVGETMIYVPTPAAARTDRLRVRQARIENRTQKRAKKDLGELPSLESIANDLVLDESNVYQSLTTLNPRPNSNAQYVGIFSRLDRFAERIGDNVSRFILRDQAFQLCPPIQVRLLICFMRYQTQKGDILDMNGTLLLDIRQKKIQGLGSWKKVKSLKQFRSAVSKLHRVRGHPGPWYGKCTICIGLFQENYQSDGCVHHQGHRRIEEVGNPVTHPHFVKEYEVLADSLDKTTQSARALDPFQFLTFGRHLVKLAIDAKGKEESIYWVKIWTMFILSSNLYLRNDDVSELQFQDIIPSDSQINPCGELERIGFLVQGKCESMDYVCLLLWRNRANRFLNAINWLLMYLHMTGIRDGYIFTKNSVSEEPMLEKDYCREIHTQLEVCFPSIDWKRCGSHCGKKTSYLLARLAGGEEIPVTEAARNRTTEAARSYERDCATIKAILEAQNISFDHLVDVPWRGQVLLNKKDGRSYSRETHLAAEVDNIQPTLENWLKNFRRIWNLPTVSLQDWVATLEDAWRMRRESFKLMKDLATYFGNTDWDSYETRLPTLKAQTSALLSSFQSINFALHSSPILQIEETNCKLNGFILSLQ